jgi:hypothetical protein
MKKYLGGILYCKDVDKLTKSCYVDLEVAIIPWDASLAPPFFRSKHKNDIYCRYVRILSGLASSL